MESMRLLHAVPEQKEEEESSLLQQELITGLAELYQTSRGTDDKRGKKRGTQRTPVKQKMKTMSRSLQMLNVARLNVKAQKSQADAEQPGPEGRGPDRQGKRRSSDRKKSERAKSISFTTEAELLSHLKSSYEQTVAERDSSLLTSVQLLLSAVKSFLPAESDLKVKTSQFVQQHLFKTSKSIRQQYGSTADVDGKVRECQLQALLRLDLCKLFSSQQSDSLDVDQMAEEVAEMLRIISRTKDPVCMTRFLQDEVFPGFLMAVPRVLADVYHSLGTQLPEVLVAVLPADFFSDDSVAKDSVSPSASSPPLSHSLASEGGGLQDLRNRSANKRRSGMLTRHRSTTESSQSLRQIEIPKKTTRASKSKTFSALEKPVPEPQPQKQETQEVTKVRRNLFTQEVLSPSKKAKLPRSQSVSAVEGLKRKRSHEAEERHKLLTRTVCETPHHKQVSSRLLYRQRVGRRSAPTEDCIVEESPVKPAEDLRRSPRIQNFARRHSNTFYSSSQPRSRNLERALSASQLTLSEGKISELNVKTIRSPMRLLFGAPESPSRLSDPSRATRSTRSRLFTDSSVFESPNKTPTKSPAKHERTNQGTPRTPKTPRTRGSPKTPPTSRLLQSPAAGSSGGPGMSLRGSPFRSPARKTLIVETPTKQSPMRSPLKGILRTPIKALVDSSGSHMLSSPVSRTPKKSVTWSPSPRKSRLVESSGLFKVPESPRFGSRTSPRLTNTPNKFSSPVRNTKRDIFKTPEKTGGPRLVRESEKENHQRSSVEVQTNKTPEKSHTVIKTSPPQSTPPQSRPPSPKLNTKTQTKTPSPTHPMVTRSGRTPDKSSDVASPCKLLSTPPGGAAAASEGSDTSVKSPAKSPRRKRSGQGARTFRQKLRSHSGENLHDKPDPVPPETTREDPPEEERADHSQTSEGNSSSDSQQLDSSRFNSATTDDDSLDIVNASVVKTQFSGGLKMNISFSRKPSKSGEDFLADALSPKPRLLNQGTPSRSYGFRQTPDRQQREAAARLGTDPPRFSTPRGPAKGSQRKGAGSQTPLSYQVEMEMQTSGLPKLKFRRTDSMNAGEVVSGGAQSPLVVVRPPQIESPLALRSKHREPGCVSPSVCTHVTPAKSTPGKSVQTYICQSYTPTRHHAVPVSPDLIPLTPSPQSLGKVTPDNLNSWPRRKRAQVGVGGGKDRGLKGEPLLAELLEEAELGVSRLQDMEDMDEPSNVKPADGCPQSPGESLIWMERLSEQTDRADPQRAEEENIWGVDSEDGKSAATPPSSKKRKPVTPSGILALTHSPMLFKGRTSSVSKRAPNFKDEAASGRRAEVDGVELSPFSQPIRRSTTGKSYSRKRLLH
ncbi:LOW QUALITY PROTEIN: treslin [Xyrichtys novacula]|nr:LOW QUALITY PROTEIN: treslin [Xyrichtys novacula]